MIDPNLLRLYTNETIKKLKLRGFYLDVRSFEKYEKHRKMLQSKIEKMQSRRHALSEHIHKKKKSNSDIATLLHEANDIKTNIKYTKKKLIAINTKINKILLSIPNIPDNEVPFGTSKTDNKQVSVWGKPKTFKFNIRNHIELGNITSGMDFQSAIKISGPKFVVMYAKIAALYRAIGQFMIDLHVKKHNYTEVYVPYLVNENSLYGAGKLPKFNNELFYIKNDDSLKHKKYALIPTSEVSLVNLLKNKTVDKSLLPIKMVANTPCFRSEAGTYGKCSRGLIRLHQFDKVELIQAVCEKDSNEALENVTNHAENVLKLLHLPYRKVLLCTGDMSFGSHKSYDLEVWMPSQNSYVEVSSCSNMGSFQSRRIKAKYKIKEKKKSHLLHIINGSGLAIGRTLAAIMENYQCENGSIEIPEILIPYMNRHSICLTNNNKIISQR